MEGVITEFDREIYRKKTHFLIERFREGPASWECEINNGNSYNFILRDGTKLNILEFDVDKKETEYQKKVFDKYKVLLAEINGALVGFLTVGIHNRKEGEESISKSDVGVIVKGVGLGSRLEKVKQYILQKEANESGDIVDLGDDENSVTIANELSLVKEKFKNDKNRDIYVKSLRELRRQRLQWLRLYGKDGKAGYDHYGYTKWNKNILSKKFQKGKPLPELNCDITENTANLREEVNKIRW